MNYPLISEYIEAIRYAEDNFDELSNLRPVLDGDGNPVMSSGNFAVVFKMTDGKKDYAIKCFTREQEGRVDAYKQISKELEFLSSPFMCGISFFEKELFVDTKNSAETDFPVLQMDWVEGVTLDEHIRRCLNDKYELEKLAFQFCQMAQWLVSQPFAHGDLKPDNILVKDDGTLVLVDYDGMFVPAMKGEKARELGSPNYRHPLRTEEQFDEHIDDFTLASIALSLQAIAMKPDLYNKFGAADRLLFSEEDFRNLGDSKLVGALQALMSDADFLRLYGLFIIAYTEQDLSNVSFRLLRISKTTKPIISEQRSTTVTKKDWQNAIAEHLMSHDSVYYNRDHTKILSYNSHYNTKYTIKEGVITICDNCFNDMGDEFDSYYLEKLKLPESIRFIGDFAFCSSIKEIICNSPHFTTHNGFLLSFDKKILYRYYGREEEVEIPDTVEHVMGGAFSECSSIRKITIPASVKEMGDNPFAGMFYFSQGYELSHEITIISNSQYYKVINKQLYDVRGMELIACWSEDEEISFEQETTKIRGYALYFLSCKVINLPPKLQFIDNMAFYYCLNIKEMNSPLNKADEYKKLCKDLKITSISLT